MLSRSSSGQFPTDTLWTCSGKPADPNFILFLSCSNSFYTHLSAFRDSEVYTVIIHCGNGLVNRIPALFRLFCRMCEKLFQNGAAYWHNDRIPRFFAIFCMFLQNGHAFLRYTICKPAGCVHLINNRAGKRLGYSLYVYNCSAPSKKPLLRSMQKGLYPVYSVSRKRIHLPCSQVT